VPAGHLRLGTFQTPANLREMPHPSKIVHLRDARKAPHRIEDDPAQLAQALQAGEAWAERALLERHTLHVKRILTRILSARVDLDDLVQEVFVRAFRRVEELREPWAVRPWLTAITVFVAREAIRAKRRRWWLLFLPPEEMPEIVAPLASPEMRAAVRAFYEVVGQLDTDARIAFTLRFVEGMELAEVASACGVSIATIKRRIKSAEAEFAERGQAHEMLAEWFEEGTRWRRP
jgi:RNA polymerase sigma-70 factor, ECF subfamily